MQEYLLRSASCSAERCSISPAAQLTLRPVDHQPRADRTSTQRNSASSHGIETPLPDVDAMGQVHVAHRPYLAENRGRSPHVKTNPRLPKMELLWRDAADSDQEKIGSRSIQYRRATRAEKRHVGTDPVRRSG